MPCCPCLLTLVKDNVTLYAPLYVNIKSLLSDKSNVTVELLLIVIAPCVKVKVFAVVISPEILNESLTFTLPPILTLLAIPTPPSTIKAPLVVLVD